MMGHSHMHVCIYVNMVNVRRNKKTKKNMINYYLFYSDSDYIK